MLGEGKQIGHFTIIKKLGEGGMGAVYLAEDTKLHRQVALKVIAAEFLDDPERGRRFQREARTAAQINHPNVMAIYDIGTATDEETGRNISFIVMEYVPGRSLGDYLVEKQPEMKELIRIAEKIASGLAAAHKLNIVHRDIKPDNILIDENKEPKILDFGLAKPLEAFAFEEQSDSTETVSQELTKVGKIMGTVSYMSPEQVQGQPVDTRSDIF
ncbi:MAG: serine/threonine protein kinase, partial [Candidatus Zixiibacteriota bacterium]